MYTSERVMQRTQIYLTESERKGLLSISKETGFHLSALIREAIDAFIEKKQHEKSKKQKSLKSAAGMWSKHTNLPNIRNLRKEFDRE